MQLAGTTCAICRKHVLIDCDATWCARCSSVLHRDCLSQGDGRCPTCLSAYEPPETHFVFSRVCPECFRPTNPPRPHCSACVARTRWDTQADYNNFVEQMKDTSRVYALRGIAELIGGFACLLALVAILWLSTRPSFLGLTLFLLGFMTLVADGLVSLIKSRKIARFQ